MNNSFHNDTSIKSCHIASSLRNLKKEKIIKRIFFFLVASMRFIKENPQNYSFFMWNNLVLPLNIHLYSHFMFIPSPCPENSWMSHAYNEKISKMHNSQSPNNAEHFMKIFVVFLLLLDLILFYGIQLDFSMNFEATVEWNVVNEMSKLFHDLISLCLLWWTSKYSRFFP